MRSAMPIAAPKGEMGRSGSVSRMGMRSGTPYTLAVELKTRRSIPASITARMTVSAGRSVSWYSASGSLTDWPTWPLPEKWTTSVTPRSRKTWP